MKYCNRPFDSLYCMPGGNISLCSWTNAVIGNIMEEDFDHVWHGEKAELVRDSIKDGSFRYCNKLTCPFCQNDTLVEMDEEELQSRSEKETPLYINIANDYTCNHSCPSCRKGIFVPSEEYRENFKNAGKKLIPLLLKADKISANGNGDLFSSSMMLDMLSQVYPENKDCQIVLETNGVLFDKAHWDKIKHFGDYDLKVVVTANSFCEPVYKYLNGGHNTYHQLLDNLQFIKSLRMKNIINEFEIAMVLQESNFREIVDFIKKSLMEYYADKVIIRPLYKWFGIHEEDYWFKDILNPYHPYHKEWLTFLDNPILDDPKVYLWGAKNLHEPRLHPAYKFRDLLHVAKELLMIPQAGNKIAAMLKAKGIRELIIYGDNELSYILYGLMVDTDVRIKCILTRDVDCSNHGSIQAELLQEYQLEDQDTILISNYFDRKYIERDLSMKLYKGQVLDIKEVLEELQK